MRHSVYGKKLSRDKNQRTALFKSLVQSLILSESIQTTQSKAKAIKSLVDKIITQAKEPSTRRFVNQFLTSKQTQDRLVNELLPRLKDRQSGYTSVIKLGQRQGDGAMMVKMSLLVSQAKETSEVKSKADKDKNKTTTNEAATDVKTKITKVAKALKISKDSKKGEKS